MGVKAAQSKTLLLSMSPPPSVQVQLVRIQLRVPEYGWTTQKVFHLLNALVCTLRAGSFLFRAQLEQLHPDAVRLVLFDLPGAWNTRRHSCADGAKLISAPAVRCLAHPCPHGHHALHYW
jgi:Protein of unknown function (DUF1084)